MTSFVERVAGLALATFDALPAKCKPRTLADGRQEWTPMSAVVLARDGMDEELTCVSLATGTKCLPASAIPKCQGLVLHDSHAEVLALRGFNRWLLEEIQVMVEHPSCQSPYLEHTCWPPARLNDDQSEPVPHPPFRLKPDISIHFLTTEAPCGDASMELLMTSLPAEAAVPWAVEVDASSLLLGRGHFSLLGRVRRKPARADAEPSMSKSCSDKLALKQFTSVLAFPADLFVEKTASSFINSLVVYEDQYDATGYDRAFGPNGRLADLEDEGHFFAVHRLPSHSRRFAFERPRAHSDSPVSLGTKASNISALWIRSSTTSDSDCNEVLINGVKQGYKQWDERSTKASCTSRHALWSLARRIARDMDTKYANSAEGHGQDQAEIPLQPTASIYIPASTYGKAKGSGTRRVIANSKTEIINIMGNWTKNSGDDYWTCQRD